MSKPTAKTPSTCPVCAGHAIFEFWEMQNLPVRCNVLCRTPAEALAAPRGDIRLSACEECGFIWNAAFETEHMAYDEAYENSLHFSPRFQAYANKLADRLVREYDLHDKDIVEIACGQGDFLRLLCERGNNRGLGFDPSYRTNGPRTAHHPAVTIIQGYYDERCADREVDLVCCRHALEHMSDPVGFLRSVRRAIGDRDTLVFFEVPNVMYTLRDLGIWDIIYEHYGYFSTPSLNNCFARAGFACERSAEEYQGQFLTIEARPARNEERGPCRDRAADVVAAAREFRGRFDEKLAEWTRQFASVRDSSGRVVLWGAGSKGVTILNMLKLAAGLEPVEYVVDINPRKQGCYVCGVGQRIVSPQFLCEYRPDTVMVMNPAYLDEVRSALSGLRVSAQLWTA